MKLPVNDIINKTGGDIMRLFSEDIFKKMTYDIDYRYQMNTIIFTMITGSISVVFLITNLMSKEYLLASIVGFLSILSFSISIYVDLTGNYKNPAYVITVSGVIVFITFAYFGFVEGFSAIWLCLLPFWFLFLYGYKWGIMLSVLMQLVLVIMFWSPFSSMMAYQYNQSFILRFPILYLACVVSSVVMELSRENMLKRLNESVVLLEKVSRVDKLTETDNRRAFEERYEDMWKLFKNKDEKFSIMMIDIDSFKNYNDNYGHQEGDVVLKKVANEIRKVTDRSGGYTSRWGGEEFVCLVPFADETDISWLANNICESIYDLQITHEYSSTSLGVLTVSIGVCTIYDFSDENKNTSLATADKSMYEAKASGKNRVGKAYLIK